MAFSFTQTTQLSAKLDGSVVKQREQAGRKLSYIEAWQAIATANEIFGFDGWHRETTEIKCVSEREREIGQYKKPGWGVSYTAKVRVTVFAGTDVPNDVVREGVGAGHGIDVDLGQAHESAIKEAESDAMKRALMTFGNPFGLALYDKTQENVERSSGAAKPPPQSGSVRATTGEVQNGRAVANPAFQQQKAEDLIRLIKTTTNTDELVELWTDEADTIRSLPPSWKDTVTAAKDEQKRKLQQTTVEVG